MAKHTDPKPYIETDDTEGNSGHYTGISPEGNSDDTEGNAFKIGEPSAVEGQDTEGNSAKALAPAVSAEGETDDTEGNSGNCRF